MSTQFNIMNWKPVEIGIPHIIGTKAFKDFTVPTSNSDAWRSRIVPRLENLNTKIYAKDVDAIVIPTNYACVMGAGLAKSMEAMFPGLGQMFLAITGVDATQVKGIMAPKPVALNRAYLKPVYRIKKSWRKRHAVKVKASFAKPKIALLYFPVKRHWSEKAQLDIICQSVNNLYKWMETRPRYTKVAIPKVGCGNGRLKWTLVAPKLIPLLRTERVRVYDFPPSLPLMHRDLLYDWVGSATPHYRGVAEYETRGAELEAQLIRAKAKEAKVRIKCNNFYERNCSQTRENRNYSVHCQSIGFFDGNILPNCYQCLASIKCHRVLRQAKKNVELVKADIAAYEKVWSDKEVGRIMYAHKGYKNNSLKRCTKVLLNTHGNDPSRGQKSLARTLIRAKEVRILYCNEVRNQWKQPEIIAIVNQYLSYCGKVTVYDYREDTLKVWEGKKFLEENYPDDTPDRGAALVETTRERIRVADYLKEYDYNDYPLPAFIANDDQTFVERHVEFTDFDKNEVKTIKSTSMIKEVMSDDEIRDWLIHKIYMENVLPTLKAKKQKLFVKVTPLIREVKDLYIDYMSDGHLVRCYRHVTLPVKEVTRFHVESVNYGFTSGRELDLPLFSSDINPDWCYSTGIGKATIGGNDEYGGDAYTDSVE